MHHHSFRLRLSLFALTTIAFATGCPQCAPGQVGAGVASLTVRNVGAVASLVNADDDCGFASTAVLTAPEISGSPGTEGTVTYTVEDCVFDLGDSLVDVSEDCEGNKTQASGKVTVSATRAIGGLITGDSTRPVIPGGPDAVTVTLTEVTFENFRVEKSNSDNILVWIEGGISGSLSPRLAVSATSGACSIASPITAFSDLTYTLSTLHVTTPDNDFDVEVAGSNLSAQNGANGNDENSVTGEITVFGTPVEIDEDLDPDYTAEDFLASWVCADDLADPISFECLDLNPRLADGAARMTVKTFGTLAGIVNTDATCGFASATAVPTVTGVPGGAGSISIAITDCEITLPEGTILPADCSDNTTTVGGTFTVSGTKVVEGVISGSVSAATAVIPASDQPATITLTITPSNLTVASGTNSLMLVNGTLAGSLTPRTALSNATGACSVSTPAAVFTDLTVTGANAMLTSPSGTFGLVISSADLDATNGSVDANENTLAGSLSLDGEAYTVPSDGLGLDPAYDATAFNAAWQCHPELVTPVSYACDASAFGQVVGGVSALTMRTLGTVVSLIDADDTCGFSSAPVGGLPAFEPANSVVGDDGVTATFSLGAGGCTLNFGATPVVVNSDCTNATTSVKGTVVVSGTKRVTGFRTGDPTAPIVPTSTSPAEYDLSITFTDFEVTSSASTASLLVSTGSLSGTAGPRVGLAAANGTCSVGTPNVTFSDVAWGTSQVTLTSGTSAYTLGITVSDLDAQNGTDGTTTNALSGSIDIGTTNYPLGTLPLDPEYDQAAFDATYSCDPELQVLADGSTVPPVDGICKQFVAEAAARLLVKSVGVATSTFDKYPVCGFASPSPNAVPTAVVGDPGGPGSLTFSATDCPVAGPNADYQLAIDCLGNTTILGGGSVTIDGTKLVEGLRLPDPPLVPISREAATFTLTEMAFNAFEVYGLGIGQVAGTDTPETASTITGTVAATVSPVAGQSIASSTAVGMPIYSLSTPIAGIDVSTTEPVTVTVFNDGKTFTVEIDDVTLSAFNGAYHDGTDQVGANSIAGTLTVDGYATGVAVGSPLDPEYSQTAFDESYVCTPDLTATVPFEAL
jgi:hypothetical protein